MTMQTFSPGRTTPSRRGESTGCCRACRTTSAGVPEALEALLFLLQCSTKEKLNDQLSKMQMLDMVVRDW